MHIFSLALKIQSPSCGRIDDQQPFDASQTTKLRPLRLKAAVFHAASKATMAGLG